MENKHVQALLACEDPQFREIGEQELVRQFPATASMLVRYLFACERDEMRRLAALMRNRFLFLRKSYGPPHGAQPPYQIFDGCRTDMIAFLRAVEHECQGLDGAFLQDAVDALAKFPGVLGELTDILSRTHGTSAAESLAHLSARLCSRTVPRQLMIFLSFRCNLSCEYCFSKDSEGTWEFDRLQARLEWARNQSVEVITFCGGEPTIYPRFSEVLDRLGDMGLRTYFATNLLCPADVLKRLTPDRVEALIVHLAHREAYGRGQWEAFISNLMAVRARGVNVALRTNISNHNHDWSHLTGLLDQRVVDEVHTALVFPSKTRTNVHLRRDDFRDFIPDVIAMKQNVEKREARFVLSKPLPPCLFPEEMRHDVLQSPEFAPLCSAFEDSFTHNACIMPDESYAPCLALMGESIKASDVNTWDMLARNCGERLGPLFDSPLFDECHGCFLYERRICQGACVGHKTGEETGCHNAH